MGDARLDPDEVTRLTGIAPTRSWRVGDRRSRNGVELRPEEDSGWRFQLGPSFSIELPNQLEGLLEQFDPHVIGIRDLVSRPGAEVEVSVHVVMAEQTPIGTFEHSLLERIVALGADLDVDLYVVEEDYFSEG